MLGMPVQKGLTRKILKSLVRLVGALLFLQLLGCAVNPVSGDHDFVMLSEDSELAIGRANDPKIIAQYGRYPNEVLQAYVQSVGERLAKVSHRKNLVYRFTVLDSPIVNAFALPGGYIYISRGLMAYLNSEAQLAAVLGHEIGHVTARHGVRQQSAAQAANLGYTIGAILFPELRAAPSQNLFNVVGGALLSGYGREFELQADHLGAEYLAKAGYTPNAMIDVIRVLKAQETFAAAEAKKQGQKYQGYHGLFASHPDNDTRLHEAVAAADKYSDVKNGQTLRDVYLKQINGLTFGDSEAQGIRSGNHFYHMAMHFALEFPQHWHINNRSKGLQAIAPQGKALIEVGVADVNRKQTPLEFIETRLKVGQLQSPQPLNTNGLQGYTGLTQVKGKTVRVGVIFLHEKAYIFFAGTKDNADIKYYDADFMATMRSLHDLRKDEIPLAKSLKIETVQAGKGDSYANWAKSSRISNSPQQQLRLLNGDYPSGQIKLGKLYKRID